MTCINGGFKPMTNKICIFCGSELKLKLLMTPGDGKMDDSEKLGWELKNKGDFKGAIKSFDKAIDENHPKKYFALHGKGECLLGLNQAEDALECFNAAIDIDPNHSWAYHGAARAHYCLGNYETARTYCNKSIDINNKSTYAWFWRGKALIKLHRINDAIDALKKALSYATHYRRDKIPDIEKELKEITDYRDALEKENEQLKKEIQELKKTKSDAQIVIHGDVNAPINNNKGGILAADEAIVNRPNIGSSPVHNAITNGKCICPKCGTLIEDGDKYCNFCWSKL